MVERAWQTIRGIFGVSRCKAYYYISQNIIVIIQQKRQHQQQQKNSFIQIAYYFKAFTLDQWEIHYYVVISFFPLIFKHF